MTVPIISLPLSLYNFFYGVFVLVFFCGLAFSESLLAIKIGDTTLHVEIANTEEQWKRGLQHRAALPVDQGMLFIFPEKKTLTFWMKDTLIPLDIAFIDSEGRLFQIESMQPLSLRSVRSQKKCALALEIRQGWLREKGISLETKVLIPKSTGVV